MDETRQVRDRSEHWSVEDCCWRRRSDVPADPQVTLPAQRSTPQQERQPALP